MAFDQELLDAMPVGVVVLNREGRVVAFNAREETRSGRRREDAIGRGFFEEIAPALDIAEIAGRFRAGLAQEGHALGAVTTRLRFVERDGERFGVLTFEDDPPSVLRGGLAELRHDLLSPLMVVSGTLDLLLDERSSTHTTDDARRAALRDGVSATDRVTRVLLSMFDIVRFDAGPPSLQRQPIDLGELLGEIKCASPDFSCGVTLSLEKSLHALVEVSLVRRALESVFDNALRQSLERLPILVRAFRDGSPMEGTCVAIEVRDAGPPITEDAREAIFEPGGLLDDCGRRMANFGLGLTLARLVARAHGGDVVALAREDGNGALFRLTFPAMPIPDRAV